MQPCMTDKPQVECFSTNSTGIRFGARVSEFMTAKMMAANASSEQTKLIRRALTSLT